MGAEVGGGCDEPAGAAQVSSGVLRRHLGKPLPLFFISCHVAS